jgi:hydrogenase maturation factor/beta-phosphoglucomutase-like phosphatase (HAD superfamily)
MTKTKRNTGQIRVQTGTTPVKAVIFDLETSLVGVDDHDSEEIKAAIGCPADKSILDHVRSISKAEKKKRILSKLEDFDLEAAEKSQPQPGAEEILQYLVGKKLRLAVVCSRSRRAAQKMIGKIRGIGSGDFHTIISREQRQTQKEGADPIRTASENLKLSPAQVAVVTGNAAIADYGRRGGALTVIIDPSVRARNIAGRETLHISHLNEFKAVVRMGIPLPAGKLPNDLLREFLNQFVFDDPAIIINPGVGEDIAAVDVSAEEVLVLKSDPITFATDSIGQYAVLVNANDIATSGAKPRWLLTTLLFPCGITPWEIRKVINELKEFCGRWEITLCGGHTEITDAVARPVVTGMMAGTVARHSLIDKRNMAPGDRVLLTKAVAVEGTAIIAREFGDRLKRFGMTDPEIHSCRQFLTDISIITEAGIAAGSKATSGMHDVTEGGLATALEELGIAGGFRIKVYMDRIPVFAQTRKICGLLGIDPLGLIGSGSLLICCRESVCESLMEGIRMEGIDVTCIGEIVEEGRGIIAEKNGRPVPWPQFETDEITRLF